VFSADLEEGAELCESSVERVITVAVGS
jgi:hypothetical protein